MVLHEPLVKLISPELTEGLIPFLSASSGYIHLVHTRGRDFAPVLTMAIGLKFEIALITYIDTAAMSLLQKVTFIQFPFCGIKKRALAVKRCALNF